MSDHFFVRDGQGHIVPRPVLEAEHGLVAGVPSTAGLPHLCRVHHRHQHFLSTDGIHLFSQDVFNLGHDQVTQWQVGVNARSQRTDHSRPQEQLVADHFGIGRCLAQRAPERLGYSHDGSFRVPLDYTK